MLVWENKLARFDRRGADAGMPGGISFALRGPQARAAEFAETRRTSRSRMRA